VAIGAQRARPGARVVCCVGDGSLQMNIQELASLVSYELPVKIVVLDNHRLGIVSQFQQLNWGRDPTCGEKWNPDFAAIARAYGLLAETVPDRNALEPALARALAAPGPALVHCIIDPGEDISPMLLAGQTIDAMWARG
jgi:acetolactate synthase-1/2/3 large subunit